MKKTTVSLWLLAVLSACGNEEKNKDLPDTVISREAINLKEIVGTGKIEPEAGIISLAAASGGIVQAVLKKEGDRVQEGEALVQLNNDLELIRIRQLQQQLLSQQDQVAMDKAALKVEQLKLTNKNKLLGSNTALFAKGATTRQELDDLETETQTLKALLQKGQASVSLSENKLAELEEQLKTARAETAKKTLRAPAAGRLLMIAAKQGSALNQYSEYAEFAPEGKLVVRAEVDELFSSRLMTGQQVIIRNLGSTEALATGKISMLSPYLKKKSLFSEKTSEQEDRRVREIRVEIDGDMPLIINSKVEVVIKTQP